MNDDIVIRLMDLPHSVKGFTSPSPDGTYNVYINARHTCETQLAVCEHEIKHIRRGDFESDEYVADIEAVYKCIKTKNF